MLTNKQAISKIKKEYNKNFKKFGDEIGWYVDKETPETYAWVFELKGRKVEIECNKLNGEIKVL